jgi:Putative transposase DNA-binding domain
VHGKRLRDWRIGHPMSVLQDKAEAAGITVKMTDERGTSSTCPSCSRRVPKPAGRVFRCPRCGHGGHLAAAPARMGEAHDGLGRADRPGVVPAGETGGDVIDDGQQLGAVVLELLPGLAEREREAPDLAVADGLLAAGTGGQVTSG